MNSREHCGVRTGWIFALLVLFVHGCAGYVPGRQAYWDAQVRQMCEKDGGVQIFEKLRISKSDLDHLGRVDGLIGVAPKNLAHPSAPAYSETIRTYLQEGNPRVRRVETKVVRRVDQAVVAKWVFYARSGGDFPTGLSEGSSYSCPDWPAIMSQLQQLFVIEGDSR